MKIIFTTLLLLTSTAFSTQYSEPPEFAETASAPFGAFTRGNTLYVTVLRDCNTLGAKLTVSNSCDKNRLTRNLALSCKVKLNIITTLMLCPAMVYPPKVFVFDLASHPIAPEAQELIIEIGEHSVQVKVNR